MEHFDHQRFYERVGVDKSIWNTSPDSPTYFQEMLRYEVIARTLPSKTARVVDLGCGDGYLSYMLAQKGFDMFSVDLAFSRLEKIRDVRKQYPITLIRTDIKRLALASQSVDAVVCSEVLEHIPDYENVIREAARILSPGGIFVVTVPYKERLKTYICPHCLKVFHPDGHLHSFDKSNLVRAVKKIGFQVTKVKTFRHRLLVHLQYHFHLKYGLLLRLADKLLCAITPEFTWYLLLVARKK